MVTKHHSIPGFSVRAGDLPQAREQPLVHVARASATHIYPCRYLGCPLAPRANGVVILCCEPSTYSFGDIYIQPVAHASRPRTGLLRLPVPSRVLLPLPLLLLLACVPCSASPPGRRLSSARGPPRNGPGLPGPAPNKLWLRQLAGGPELFGFSKRRWWAMAQPFWWLYPAVFWQLSAPYLNVSMPHALSGLADRSGGRCLSLRLHRTPRR